MSQRGRRHLETALVRCSVNPGKTTAVSCLPKMPYAWFNLVFSGESRSPSIHSVRDCIHHTDSTEQELFHIGMI